MEKLRAAVPDNLKRKISETPVDDLPSACSSLLDFFLHLQQFHQIVADLASRESALCGKDRVSALELKRKGNECFAAGDYRKALSFYTQALRLAPIDAVDMDRNLVAVLYLNRASVLHKMELLVECLRDCDRAVALYPGYAKAWYRRGKTNINLSNYEEAVHDLNLAMKFELSLTGKRQIESELMLLLNFGKDTDSSLPNYDSTNLSFSDIMNCR